MKARSLALKVLIGELALAASLGVQDGLTGALSRVHLAAAVPLRLRQIPPELVFCFISSKHFSRDGSAKLRVELFFYSFAHFGKTHSLHWLGGSNVASRDKRAIYCDRWIVGSLLATVTAQIPGGLLDFEW
jgi:hypothetical protein